MKTLNVIGAGRVGTSLASLWHSHGVFTLGDVLDGTPEGARDAVAAIGAGDAAATLDDMRPAEVWMIATPDRAIAQSARALAALGVLRAGDVVFHCSGSLEASELSAVAGSGAVTASVHPLKSFAEAALAVRSFGGTYCAAEGEAAALAALAPAFEAIGGRVFTIDAASKTLYHAASVVVCNYLTALMEAGLRGFEKSGVERATAMAMMEPLVRETLDNVFSLGTEAALTGPVARGDAGIVERHLAALHAWDPRMACIYRDLGVLALELARVRGSADAAALERLEAVLARS